MQQWLRRQRVPARSKEERARKKREAYELHRYGYPRTNTGYSAWLGRINDICNMLDSEDVMPSQKRKLRSMRKKLLHMSEATRQGYRPRKTLEEIIAEFEVECGADPEKRQS